MKEINEKERAFGAVVPQLIRKAEAILADDKMTATPSGVSCGTCFSGNREATVGDFLHWWKDSPELSHDTLGNPLIRHIGGLTGVHDCLAADADGNVYPAQLKAHFFEVLRDYAACRKKYPQAVSQHTLSSLLGKLSDRYERITPER